MIAVVWSWPARPLRWLCRPRRRRWLLIRRQTTSGVRNSKTRCRHPATTYPRSVTGCAVRETACNTATRNCVSSANRWWLTLGWDCCWSLRCPSSGTCKHYWIVGRCRHRRRHVSSATGNRTTGFCIASCRTARRGRRTRWRRRPRRRIAERNWRWPTAATGWTAGERWPSPVFRPTAGLRPTCWFSNQTRSRRTVGIS